jgi:hypothetical protein
MMGEMFCNGAIKHDLCQEAIADDYVPISCLSEERKVFWTIIFVVGSKKLVFYIERQGNQRNQSFRYQNRSQVVIMPRIKMERDFHPNGRPRWEGHFENGIPEGTNREWHDNGVMSRDRSLKKGLQHGLARQWNRDGKLLGEYLMDHGTGIEKSWYENGQLERECSAVNGKLCGRFRCWFEDGDLVSTIYHIYDKQVSKKKYDEACKSDPTLPRFDDDGQKSKLKLPSTKYRKSKAKVSEEERKQHDALILEFRAKPNHSEARQWLTDNENRNLGEMTPEASREVIDNGYTAGATKIMAVGVTDKSTNHLIVELPTVLSKRKRVFEWNNILAQNSGFDPDDDWGQNELFIFFD